MAGLDRDEPSNRKLERVGDVQQRFQLWHDVRKAIEDGQPPPLPEVPPADPAMRAGADSAPDRFDALVPKRFRHVALDGFETVTPSQAAARASIDVWLDRARRGVPAMLALIGSQGTGKSHLLYAAAGALYESGVEFYARPWYRLADELRYGGRSAYNPARAFDAPEVRAQLWAARVVLLDEVRATAGTSFDDTELTKYACHAYDAGLAVLITTNVNPLADVMGPAAASRFVQITVEGPDRRQAR